MYFGQKGKKSKSDLFKRKNEVRRKISYNMGLLIFGARRSDTSQKTPRSLVNAISGSVFPRA